VGDLQSYNRYSYAQNNPLRYTDPTGHFISPGFDILVNFGFSVLSAVACSSNPVACAGVSIAAAIYNATSQINAGMPGDLVILNSFVSVATASVKAYVAVEKEVKPVQRLVTGAVSERVSSSMTRFVSGRDLGENVLAEAAEAADWAGVAATAQASGEVSEDGSKQAEFEAQQEAVFREGDASASLLVADGGESPKPATKPTLKQRFGNWARGSILGKYLDLKGGSFDDAEKVKKPASEALKDRTKPADQRSGGKLGKKGGGKLGGGFGGLLMLPEIIFELRDLKRALDEGKSVGDWINESPTPEIFKKPLRKLGYPELI
jgi:hypothetical protein